MAFFLNERDFTPFQFVSYKRFGYLNFSRNTQDADSDIDRMFTFALVHTTRGQYNAIYREAYFDSSTTINNKLLAGQILNIKSLQSLGGVGLVSVWD